MNLGDYLSYFRKKKKKKKPTNLQFEILKNNNLF